VKTLSGTNRATMQRHEPDLRRESQKRNDETKTGNTDHVGPRLNTIRKKK